MRETPRKDGEPNRDPLSGKPGAHPVGTGIGAAAGGAAGAAAGTAVGGPAGTVVGAAIGAIAGGLAGKGVAELVDPTEEDAYWRENHGKQPYYSQGRDYDAWAPAYRAGYEGRARYDGRSFDEVEDDLAADYARFRGNDMTWEEVRPATRAAWDRVDRRIQDMTRN
ncbi:MAG TPA: glycine zipper domain-containing protein [Usitatibacter sp.]|nr:glycine zipper domain-containing protein [Usitatibacter sp.]